MVLDRSAKWFYPRAGLVRPLCGWTNFKGRWRWYLQNTLFQLYLSHSRIQYVQRKTSQTSFLLWQYTRAKRFANWNWLIIGDGDVLEHGPWRIAKYFEYISGAWISFNHPHHCIYFSLQIVRSSCGSKVCSHSQHVCSGRKYFPECCMKREYLRFTFFHYLRFFQPLLCDRVELGIFRIVVLRIDHSDQVP